ncbi:MAG: hypothetical protein ACKO8Q_08235 [Bacteroidota bacterium]
MNSQPIFIGKRIKIERSKDLLKISIHQQIERWQEALLYAWILAWTFCGGVFLFYAFTTQVQSEKIFFGVCSGLWAYFFYRITKVLMWRKTGKEILIFTPGNMTLQNAFANKGKIEKFELSKISQLGLVKQDPNSFFYFLDDSFWVMGGERLGFSHKGIKYRFGKQLSIKDSQQLLRSVDSAVKGYSA